MRRHFLTVNSPIQVNGGDSQTGACLHCHASIIPTYRRLGMQAKGEKVDAQSLAADFNWPAVMEGFNISGKMDYSTAHAELLKTPDGTPAEPPKNSHDMGAAHPVGCIDCHDPQTMRVRVTRPGFINGIAALVRMKAVRVFATNEIEPPNEEAVRILGESIDYSRQAQAAALRLRLPPSAATKPAGKPVEGVTPTD